MADCRNQALSGRGCSREALQSMPPAMAYVPWQFWGQTLELENAHRVLSARMNPSGYLAVTAEASGYKGSVTVYGPDQEKRMALGHKADDHEDVPRLK